MLRSMLPRILAFALIAGCALPLSASADDMRSWNMVCAQGGLACVSLTVRLSYEPSLWHDGMDTRLSTTIVNHQGSAELEGVGALGFRSFGLSGLTWTPPVFENGLTMEDDFTASARASSHGNAGWVDAGNPDEIVRVNDEFAWWGDLRQRPEGASFVFEDASGEGFGLFGCDGPVGWDFAPGWYSTCGGELTIEAAFSGRLEFTPETRGGMGVSYGGEALAGHPCGVGYCTDYYGVAVPEPSPGLLMLLGLAGLGFVAYRREDEWA